MCSVVKVNLKMHYFTVVLFVSLVTISGITAAPANNSSLREGSDAKSAFGQPFDEIVVESTLNVKRRTNNNRQSKNDQAVVRTKRQFSNFPIRNNFGGSLSSATAQAQSHDANKAPFGRFGASAAGSQSQSLTFGPKGPTVSASFTGSQQYRLPNGQTFDISFGNSLGATDGINKAGGASYTIHGPSS